ncbi:MAG TPA: hypothetical protein VFQ06_11320 [Nitrospira sp.]|nr:hypothetical protein [Nitrospira sp.]
MSTEGDRQFVEAMFERAALGDRNKMQPMRAIVTEHGTGDYDGMVRVRRTPHEPPGSPERPFYYVFGEVPAVGAEVFAMSNHATGVVNGVASAGGYQTIAEGGTPVAQQPQLSFGSGFDVADNAGASRTDVTFDASEVITPIRNSLLTVDGTGSGLDADLLDGSHGTDFAPSGHVGAGGSAHPAATTSVAGFESAADKTKLDGLSNQARGLFRVHLSGAQLNIPNTTETKVNFNSEAHDVSGWYDTGTVRYTPQLQGYYQFMAGVRIFPGVANRYVRLYLRVSGLTTFRLAQAVAVDTADIDCEGPSPPVFLNGTTEYVEVVVWHNFGVGTSDLLASTIEAYFGGYFLGTT